MEELNYFTLNDTDVTITNSFDTLQQRVDNVEATVDELTARFAIVANQLGISALEARTAISALQNIYSHAEGASSVASGCYSHAEGAYAVAKGYRNFGGNALLDDVKLEEGWDWLDHDVD